MKTVNCDICGLKILENEGLPHEIERGEYLLMIGGVTHEEIKYKGHGKIGRTTKSTFNKRLDVCKSCVDSLMEDRDAVPYTNKEKGK